MDHNNILATSTATAMESNTMNGNAIGAHDGNTNTSSKLTSSGSNKSKINNYSSIMQCSMSMHVLYVQVKLFG